MSRGRSRFAGSVASRRRSRDSAACSSPARRRGRRPSSVCRARWRASRCGPCSRTRRTRGTSPPGHSSGAAIILEAANKLRKQIKKLAIYEAPYSLDKDAIKASKAYDRQLKKVLASGRKGDAVALFVRNVGVSDKQIQAMKRMPMWRGLEALAPTLAYDSDVLGEGHSLPAALLAGITIPTLVMHGGKGAPSMRDAAQAISEAVPKAQLRTIAGQTHGVSPIVLAPVLAEFFSG